MPNKPLVWPLALLMSMVLLNCGDDDDSSGGDGDNNPVDGGQETLAKLSTDIFTPNCALSGCHAGERPSAGMSLEADKIAEQIIGVTSAQNSEFKRIDPGNPAGSYLLKKVRGDEDIEFRQMPLGKDPLSDAKMDQIRDWIANGAPVE